jgi:hypothetical protein
MRIAHPKLWIILLAAAMMAMTLTVLAADQKKQPTPEEMQKMMEAWQKIAAPGAQHATLSEMAGNWTYHMTMHGIGDKPMEMDGTANSEMIFDGRFLSMKSHGTMMDMPFEGMGTMGYDNFRGEYQMTWMDNMGTMTAFTRGKTGSDPKVITLTGKMDEPTTGEKDKDVKYVWRIKDHDHHSMEAYDLVGTPQEFKAMEIAFTRKP